MKYDGGKIYGCLPFSFMKFPATHESLDKVIISEFALISTVDHFASYCTHSVW